MTQHSTTAAPAAPLTRRERQRQATYHEIVDAARQQLRSGEELSVRAVAGQLGLTPPALYRYVDSAAALAELVSRAIFDDIIEAMGTVRDLHPDDAPDRQIVAAASGFRAWALRHPEEFQHVFDTELCVDNPVFGDLSLPGVDAGEVDPDRRVEGGELFGTFFAEIFSRLWQRQRFPVPSVAELDPAFVEMCDQGPEHQRLALEQVGEDGYGMMWTFWLAWVRLYGVVMLEVNGKIQPPLVEANAVYDAIMVEIGNSLGLEGRWTDLGEVAREAERMVATLEDEGA